jgi:hypothetical protein
MLKNQNGFLLISIIFIMLLMAVSIFSINYYSVTQVRMASNHTDSVQMGYDLKAIVEESVWKLTDNLFWRTGETGEDFPGNNVPNAVPQDSVTDATTNGTTTITKAGENFLETCIVGDTVFIWDGTTQADHGVYFIETVTDNENLVLNRAPSGSDADVDFYVFRTSYTRIVRNSNTTPFNYPLDYDDAVTISIRPLGQPADKLPGESGYIRPFQRSFRYYAKTLSGISLDHPEKIFMMANGNLAIADKDHNKIIEVNPDTSSVTTIAGTGSYGYTNTNGCYLTWWHGYPKFSKPQGVCTNSSGTHYYIADTDNNRIRSITWFSSTLYCVSPIAGDGSSDFFGEGVDANTAKLNSPRDVILDSSSNLYIADTKNHCIRKVDHNLTPSIITTVAGIGKDGGYMDGGLGIAKLNEPNGICLDNNNENLYIADTKNNKIRKVNLSTGIVSTVITPTLDEPKDVFVDANNNLFIADKKNHVIHVVNAARDSFHVLAGTGSSGDTTDRPAVQTKLDEPSGITMISAYGGSQIFISDTKNQKIKVLELKTVYGL